MLFDNTHISNSVKKILRITNLVMADPTLALSNLSQQKTIYNEVFTIISKKFN